MTKTNFMSKPGLPIFLVLFLAFILRLFVMLNSGGSFHADEIFQTVEPAHRLTFGYGMRTWEWERGIRSWFLPGIYAGILFAGKSAGISDSLDLNFLIYTFNLILSLLGIYAVFLIGKESGGRNAGLIAALLAATSVFLMKFAFRPLSEPISANLIILSLALAYKGAREDRRYIVALSGTLLGLSFLVRFPSALFIIPVSIFIIMRRPKLFFTFAGTLDAILIFGGLLDLATWGSFWHAPVEFFRFNILENKSVAFGAAPVDWYLRFLFRDKLVTVFTVIFFVIGAYRNGLIFSSFLVYLAAFSFIPHKEERFLIPLIPLALILISLGIERITDILLKRNYIRNLAIFFLIVVYSLYPSFKVKKIDIIPSNRGMFLCMNYAGNQPDIKGLLYLDWWHSSGGYSYLNRNVPILFCTPDLYSPKDLEKILSKNKMEPDYGPYLLEVGNYRKLSIGDINYAIANDDRYKAILAKHLFTEIARFGDVAVYKKRRKGI